MRILTVDSDPIQLRVISSCLSKAGHEVFPMPLGDDALKFLKEGEDVDLIVSEIMMAGVDGFELLKTLKKNRRTSNLPVIFCTSVTDQSSVVKGIRLGAAGYVCKPFQSETLVEKVSDVIAHLPAEIMVVDDDDILRSLVLRVLTGGGFRAIGAQSGEEALEIVYDRKISLIITDIVMPGMSGLDVLRIVKEDVPKLPVLVMTGHSSKTDMQTEVMALGASGFITKPFHNTEILAEIQRFVRVSR